MTAATIVVGIGQIAAGDDGVGLAVARELARRGVAVRESADASILLGLLEAGHRVVVVDAVAGGGPPGSVFRLSTDDLGSGPTPLSSHGLGVAEAIALARTLYGPGVVAQLSIIGIAIDRPTVHVVGLSPAVAAAIAPAAALAAELVSHDNEITML
jgi:hydrogenase maturation protease